MINTAFVIQTVVDNTISEITHIALHKSTGEFFRKTPSNVEDITSRHKRFTFFFEDFEANDTIVKIELIMNGTSSAGTGTALSTQDIFKVKDNTKSLTIEWEVEVE